MSQSDNNPDSDEKKFISKKALTELIENELDSKFTDNFKLHISDEQYYLPSLAESEKLIGESGIDKYQWHDEVFDCDDFAIMLKAHFCKDAYKHNTRRHSHCLGIVWGMVPRPHALNWMINDDMKLRFVDPMYNEVYFPQEAARYIWMMII